MSVYAMDQVMEHVEPWTFNEDDVAAWSYVDLGSDREAFQTYHPIKMGFTATDLLATDGIYETCKYIEDFEDDAAYFCDYERVITCYDGASVGVYERYLSDADWAAGEGDEYFFSGSDGYICNTNLFTCFQFDTGSAAGAYYKEAYIYYLYKLQDLEADGVDGEDWVYNMWFQSSLAYSSAYCDDWPIENLQYTGMLAQRFVPIWQRGYDVGDIVELYTEFYDSDTIDTLTQFQDLELAGASQLMATTLACLAIAAAL